ncbi:hypothetical protein D3C86_583830 [compost metagenome]
MGCQPQQRLTHGLDRQGDQRDLGAADAVGQATRQQSHQDEAQAEACQSVAGTLPAMGQEVEGKERAQGRKADALQAHDRALLPDESQHIGEGRAAPLCRHGGRDGPQHRAADQRQGDAARHQAGEAEPLQQPEAQRAAHRESAVHAGADERHDLPGTRGAHGRHRPAQHADEREAFAEAQHETPHQKNQVRADAMAQHGQRGGPAQERCRRIEDKAPEHGELAAAFVSQTARPAATQDGGQKGNADAQAGRDIAHAQRLRHMERHGRHRHGDRQVGEKKREGHPDQRAQGRRVCLDVRHRAPLLEFSKAAPAGRMGGTMSTEATHAHRQSACGCHW